ncbi:MAG: sodium:proton antiporter [Thermodesulfobacteriota bacterium]|nr:MAG: sodium:proton antiporter [Thermodesulfobacteriota bacterium]
MLGLAAVLVLGVSAQWLAWRINIPSILILLLLGIIAGPITGFIDPDELFGEAFFPIISLSVAIILFEGGLSLKFSELRSTGLVVQRLLIVGALISWILGSLAAHYIIGLDFPLAVLLGAILVVTGPTVIIPLLMQVRPVERVSSVLRWESILIDPIGAVIAVLVYEAIVAGRFNEITWMAGFGIMKTLFYGGGIGAGAALFMILSLKRYLIPDFLQNPVTLMTVVAAYTLSNLLQSESGLLAVTVMGVVLANQKSVDIKHIVEFKENLRVLLLAGLFILLAARLKVADMKLLSVGSFIFIFVLIVFVRPISVLASTVFSDLKWRERAFIASVAPRGIVAAAVSSVFAIRMVENGYPQGSVLLPITFLVIIVTVLFYGIGGSTFARRLGVEQPTPQGFLILGSQPWAVEIAKAVKDAGFKVVIVDTNLNNIFAARMQGITSYYGSGLSETALKEIGLEGIGRLLAITPNNEVNSLAVLHFNKVFESSELYQLLPHEEEGKKGKREVPKHLRGRLVFGGDTDYWYLARRFASGAIIKKTKLTEEFGYEEFRKKYQTAIPLFLINETGQLSVFTVDKPLKPGPGNVIISIVDAADEKAVKKEAKAADEAHQY